MSRLVFLSGNKYSSGLVRGEQVADFLGCPYNPDSVKADDVVILVKSWNDDVVKHCKKVYVDVVDTDTVFGEICVNLSVSVIVFTELALCYAGARLPNEILVIPQHHCNFENKLRSNREVNTVGYVGCGLGLCLDKSLLSYKLAERGFNFLYQPLNFKELTREDLVNFLMTIDINVMFRPPMVIDGAPQELKDALKIVNAMSFGVPSVAFPCPGNLEVDGMYVQARSIDEIVSGCVKLRDEPALYAALASDGIKFAKRKHISVIAEEYKKLCPSTQT